MMLVEFDNVTKHYKKHLAIKDISFKIKKGTFNLFIGSNGSGKSTTIKLILGFLHLNKNDQGIIKVNTHKIGYVPEKIVLPLFITINEFLLDLNLLIDKKYDFKTYLEYFEIDGNYLMANLSKGMRQKVGIIQAIMQESELLILDEPTDGLDIGSLDKLIKMLKRLKNEGKTIIISTHNQDLFNQISDFTYDFSKPLCQ